MGPVEIRRKLAEVTAVLNDDLGPEPPPFKLRYSGTLDEDTFRLSDHRSPSYYGWVELAGTVEQERGVESGTTVELRVAMHDRTTNIRLGTWSVWIIILVIMLTHLDQTSIMGFVWMVIFAAVLAGMQYLDHRSCLREAEYVRTLLQGSIPEPVDAHS